MYTLFSWSLKTSQYNILIEIFQNTWKKYLGVGVITRTNKPCTAAKTTQA